MTTTFAETPLYDPFEAAEQLPDPFPQEFALDTKKAIWETDANGYLLPKFRLDDSKPYRPAAPGTLLYDSTQSEGTSVFDYFGYIDEQGCCRHTRWEVNGQLYQAFGIAPDGTLLADPAIVNRYYRILHQQPLVSEHFPNATLFFQVISVDRANTSQGYRNPGTYPNEEVPTAPLTLKQGTNTLVGPDGHMRQRPQAGSPEKTTQTPDAEELKITISDFFLSGVFGKGRGKRRAS